MLNSRSEFDNKKAGTMVRLSYAAEDDPLPKKALINTIELLSGRRRLEKIYRKVKQMNIAPKGVWEAALTNLRVHPHFNYSALADIPSKGPLIFIANHPFGVIDGLMLGHIVSLVRSEFGILVHDALCGDDLFEPFFMPVDFRATRQARDVILATRRDCLRRLSAGESIAIFPSGAVATASKPFGSAREGEWKKFVLKLIKHAKSTVIPVFFHGQNSRIFHWASSLHADLRLSLLLHETRNKMGRHFGVSIGQPIPYYTIEALGHSELCLQYLQRATLSLADDPAYRDFRCLKKQPAKAS